MQVVCNPSSHPTPRNVLMYSLLMVQHGCRSVSELVTVSALCYWCNFDIPPPYFSDYRLDGDNDVITSVSLLTCIGILVVWCWFFLVGEKKVSPLQWPFLLAIKLYVSSTISYLSFFSFLKLLINLINLIWLLCCASRCSSQNLRSCQPGPDKLVRTLSMYKSKKHSSDHKSHGISSVFSGDDFDVGL